MKNLKVSELIEKLKEYNSNAIVEVVVNNYPAPYEIAFGSSDGCTKDNCDDVSFLVCSEKEN